MLFLPLGRVKRWSPGIKSKHLTKRSTILRTQILHSELRRHSSLLRDNSSCAVLFTNIKTKFWFPHFLGAKSPRCDRLPSGGLGKDALCHWSFLNEKISVCLFGSNRNGRPQHAMSSSNWWINWWQNSIDSLLNLRDQAMWENLLDVGKGHRPKGKWTFLRREPSIWICLPGRFFSLVQVLFISTYQQVQAK